MKTSLISLAYKIQCLSICIITILCFRKKNKVETHLGLYSLQILILMYLSLSFQACQAWFLYWNQAFPNNDNGNKFNISLQYYCPKKSMTLEFFKQKFYTFSTMKAVIPCWGAADKSVLAYTMRVSASGPLVIQNFVPFST